MQRLVESVDDMSQLDSQITVSSHNHAFLYSLIIPRLLEIARTPSKELLSESFTASDLKFILLVNGQPHLDLTTKSQLVDNVFDFLVSQTIDLERIESLDEHRYQNEQFIKSLDAANTDHVSENDAHDHHISGATHDKASDHSDSQSFEDIIQQTTLPPPSFVESHDVELDPVPTIASLRDVIVLTSCVVESDARVRVSIKVIDLTPVVSSNSALHHSMSYQTANQSTNQIINQTNTHFLPDIHVSVPIIDDMDTTASDTEDEESVQSTHKVVRKRRPILSYKKKRRTHCPDCSQVLSNEVELFNHIVVSHGRHDCPTCRQSFEDEVSLKKHLTVHSRGHQHVCNFCGTSFSKIIILEGHQHLHTGERPFKCDVVGCKGAFTSKLYLSKHAHSHANNKTIATPNQHVNPDTSDQSINQTINKSKKRKVSRSTKQSTNQSINQSNAISAYFDDQPDDTKENEENDAVHSTSDFFADYHESATQTMPPHHSEKIETRYRPSSKYKLKSQHVDHYRRLHTMLTSRSITEWNEQLLISCFSKDDLSIVGAANRIVRAGNHVSRSQQAQNVLKFLCSSTLRHPDTVLANERPYCYNESDQPIIARKKPVVHLVDDNKQSVNRAISDDDSDDDSTDDTDSSSSSSSDDSSLATPKMSTNTQRRQRKIITSENIDKYRRLYPVLTSHRVVCDVRFLMSEFTGRELAVVAICNRIAGAYGGQRKHNQARCIFEFMQSNELINPDELASSGGHQSKANTSLSKDVVSEQSTLMTDLELVQSDDDFFQSQPTFKKRKRSMSTSDEESNDSDATIASKRSKSPSNDGDDVQAIDFENKSVELADYRDVYAKILSLDWHYLTPELLNSTLNESECRIVLNVHQIEHQSLSKDQLIIEIFRLLDTNGLQI